MGSVQYEKVEEIEFAIMTGEFRPRQRLVESELVERFKVGRTIIPRMPAHSGRPRHGGDPFQ